MNNNRTRLTLGLVCGVIAAGLVTGCPPQPTGGTDAAVVTATETDQPTTAATPAQAAAKDTSTAPAVLPAHAMTPLDQLEPAIAKPAGDPVEPGEQTRDLVAQAETDLAARKFTDAADKLKRAAGFEPENPRIRKNLGMAYLGLADAGRALENLQAAADKHGDDLDLQLLLGQVQEANAKPDDAMVSYRTALLTSQAKSDDPRAAEALIRLADLLARQGYFTASLEAYDQADDWISQHASAYVGKPIIERFVLRPELLQVQRARLLLKLNRPAEAVTPLQHAREADRNSATVIGLLTEAHLASGQTAKARALLQELADGGDTSAHLLSLVEKLALAQQNPALPREMWKTYVERGKRDANVAMAMASVSVKLDAIDDAQAILQSALDIQPGNLRARKQLADLFSLQRQTDKALRELAAIVALDSNQALDVSSRVHRAILRDGDFDLAAFVATIDDEGKNPHALHYVAGLAAARQRDFTAAADRQRQALATVKDFLPAWDALMDATLALRNNAAVETVLTDVQTLPETMGFVHLFLSGKVDLAKGDILSTRSACDRLYQARELARQNNRSYLPLSYTLAQALRRANRTNEAARVLKDAIDLQPENDQLQVELIRLLMTAGAVNEASTRLDDLLLRQPDSLAAKIAQVELLLKQGREKPARERLDDLKKISPTDPQVLMLDFRLNYGQRMGSLPKEDFQQATQTLAELIRADEDNAEAIDNLRRLLAQPKIRSEALAMWESAYEGTDHHPQVARQYAAALLAARQYDKAENVIREILTASPKDTPFRLALVDTLRELKKNDEAITLAQGWLKDTQEAQLEYRSRLLYLYKQETRYDEAQSLLDEWIQLEADRDRSVSLRAEKLTLLTTTEQYDQAEEFANTWIRQEQRQVGGDIGLPQNTLLYALSKAKQHDRALRLVNAWMDGKNDKDTRGLRAWQIRLLVQADKIPDATARAQAWIAKAPNDLGPRMTLVAALEEADKLEEASTLLESWLADMTVDPALSPTSIYGEEANGPGNIAPPMFDEDDEDDGEDFDEDEFDEPVGFLPALRSDVLMQQVETDGDGDAPAEKTLAPARAAPAATQPAEVKGKVAVSQELLDWTRHRAAVVLFRQGKYDQVIARVDEFVAAYPKSYFTATGFRQAMAQRLGGRDYLIRTLSNPVIDLLHLKSSSQMELGKPDDAIATLERAFNIDRDNTGLNNDLGYFYADQGINLDRAERMIRKALMSDPKNSAFKDSLGWVLYKQGKFNAASNTFDDLLSGDALHNMDHALLYDHAGDVAWRLGDKDKAKALWTQAIELGEKETKPSLDTRKVLATAPGKLEALANNQEPTVAPLGINVNLDDVEEEEEDEANPDEDGDEDAVGCL